MVNNSKATDKSQQLNSGSQLEFPQMNLMNLLQFGIQTKLWTKIRAKKLEMTTQLHLDVYVA